MTAEQTEAAYGEGVLLIETPAASPIEVKVASAELRCVGRLGDVAFEGAHGSG